MKKTTIMLFKTLLSIMMVFAMVQIQPVKAELTNGEQTVLDLAEGNIIITPESVEVGNTSFNINENGYKIIQTNSSESTENTIEIAVYGVNHAIIPEITISNVNIDTFWGSALSIANATVSITFEGNNNLKSKSRGEAGIKPRNSNVTILGENTDTTYLGGFRGVDIENSSFNIEGGTINIAAYDISTTSIEMVGNSKLNINSGKVNVEDEIKIFQNREAIIELNIGKDTSPSDAIFTFNKIYNKNDGGIINFENGIVFEGNTGTVHGNTELTQDFTLEDTQTLTIPENSKLLVQDDVTFTNKGTIEGTGTITGDGPIHNFGAINDGVEIPKDLVIDPITITAQPATTTDVVYGTYTTLTVVAESIVPDNEGTLSYEWYLDGTAIPNANEASYDTPLDLNVGSYEYYCKVTKGEYSLDSDVATVNVSKSGTEFENGIQVVNQDITYGDIITVNVKPIPNGEPVSILSLDAPITNKMAIFKGAEQVSEAVNANAYGIYTMTIDSTLLGIGTFDLTAKYVGNDNMEDYEKDFVVKVVPKVYSISATTDGNGTVDVSAASATEGTEITLTASANEGYEFDRWKVATPSDLNLSDEASVTFQMPASDVEVKAIFVEVKQQPDPIKPTRPRPSKPNYKDETVSNGDVTVGGKFDGKVEINEPNKGSDGYQDALDKVNDKDTVVDEIEIKVPNHKGDVDIVIDVDDKYNGKDVTVIYGNGKETTETVSTVTDGKLSFVIGNMTGNIVVLVVDKYRELDLKAYADSLLPVYPNSRVTSLTLTDNGFKLSGYAFIKDMQMDYINQHKLVREIIFVNEDDEDISKAYRQHVTATNKGSFLTSNKNLNPSGKVDYSYATYDVEVNYNQIMDYKKNMTALAKGKYRIFVRVSDGKHAYLMPLKDLVLSNGSTLALPSNMELVDQEERAIRLVLE